MTQLKCDVVHCQSNRDNCCCRQQIRIGGAEATQQQQTCCESFQSTKSCTSNRCGAKTTSETNPTMPVRCEATHCVHNCHCECNAPSIQVSGHTAEKMDQTQCTTFQCRCGCQ